MQYGISNNEFTYIQQPGSIFFTRVLHESNLYMKLSYLKKDFIFYRVKRTKFFLYTSEIKQKESTLERSLLSPLYPFLDCSFVFPAAMLGNHSYNFSNTFPSGLRKSFISDWMDRERSTDSSNPENL